MSGEGGNGVVRAVLISVASAAVVALATAFVAWGSMSTQLDTHERNLSVVEARTQAIGARAEQCCERLDALKSQVEKLDLKMDRMGDKMDRVLLRGSK